MNRSEAFPSRFLKAEDISPEGQIVRIKRVYKEAADADSEDRRPKIIAELYDTAKEWLLKPTNWDLITDLLRTGDSDRWVGQEIPIYQTVCTYKGDPRTPCIRVMQRAPVYGGDNGDPRISAMLKAFGEMNVTRLMLEQRLGIRSITEMTPGQRDSLKALHARMVGGERWPEPDQDLTGWLDKPNGQLVAQRPEW